MRPPVPCRFAFALSPARRACPGDTPGFRAAVRAAGGAELHGLTDALYGNRKFLEVAFRTLDADQDGKLS